MREAVLLVEQGMSIRKAAKEKGVKYPSGMSEKSKNK
jgi:transposase